MTPDYKPITEKQKKIFKEGWKQMQRDYHYYITLLSATEKWMVKESGIKDVEFFFVDGEIAGIGNESRTIELLQGEDLEQ